MTFIKILPHFGKAVKAKNSVHPNFGLTLSHKGEGADLVTFSKYCPTSARQVGQKLVFIPTSAQPSPKGGGVGTVITVNILTDFST
ncbi:hypothetical protein [Serratia sp. N21D137]|uniref:hypothetical protein n=1 Tax=Serratia sp. N21D137 TaxID=3397495 RepID=UPI0039E11D2E